MDAALGRVNWELSLGVQRGRRRRDHLGVGVRWSAWCGSEVAVLEGGEVVGLGGEVTARPEWMKHVITSVQALLLLN